MPFHSRVAIIGILGAAACSAASGDGVQTAANPAEDTARTAPASGQPSTTTASGAVKSTPSAPISASAGGAGSKSVVAANAGAPANAGAQAIGAANAAGSASTAVAAAGSAAPSSTSAAGAGAAGTNAQPSSGATTTASACDPADKTAPPQVIEYNATDYALFENGAKFYEPDAVTGKDTPNTGPYEPIIEVYPNFDKFTVYRPKTTDRLMPIIAWGNGGCVQHPLVCWSLVG